MHREGRFEEAAVEYIEVGAAQTDVTARANAYLGAAVSWYEAGEESLGAVALQEAVEAAPEETQAWRRARYLLGSRLVETGEHAEAVGILEPIFEGRYDDALQPRIDALYAEAAAASGATEKAIAAWNAALTSSHLLPSLEADIYIARIADGQRRGDGGAIALWIGELARVATDPADRFALAELALANGDRATFASQLQAIVVRDAGSPYASLAISALETEGYSVDAGDAGYVAYRHRQYPEARELLHASLDDPALTVSERAWQTYYLAAAYEDAGYPAEAIPIYDDAAALDPASDIAHRAQYWAARSAERLGRSSDASARYLALAVTGPSGSFSGEAAFRAGFVLFEAGDASGAISAWDASGAVRDGRMLYWLGRAHQSLGDPASATAAFTEAATADRLSFFGMEAARELGQPPDDFPDYVPLSEPGRPDWDAIATWLAGGTPTIAPAATETAAADLVALGLETEAAATIAESAAAPIARLRAATELGLISYSARLASSLLQPRASSLEQVPVDLLRLAYPIGYVALLDGTSALEDVDPLFVAALIRTESFWDHEAVSLADAIGLTQVIPSTGEAIANALSYEAWTPDHLRRPATSIAFGVYYISGHLHRFGNPYQALAAYNGGPGNALIWGAAASPDHPADFTEAITYSETRNYVEYVMSAYAVYRYAYKT